LDVFIVISRYTYNASNSSIGGTIRVDSDQHGNSFRGYTTERISNVDPEGGGAKWALRAGLYAAFLREDHSPARVELVGTPNYRNVQIHVGNSPADVTGCFAAGTALGRRTGEVADSVTAMQLIEEIVRRDGTGRIQSSSREPTT
jgi:hypothetical protein